MSCYYDGMTEEEFVDEAKRRFQTNKILYEINGIYSQNRNKFFRGECEMISSLVKNDVKLDIHDTYDFIGKTLSWDELKELQIKATIVEEYIQDLMESIRAAQERTLKKLEGLKDGKEGRDKGCKDGAAGDCTECG